VGGPLASDAQLGGVAIPAGARVGFWDVGGLATIVVPRSVELLGRTCLPGQILRLEQDGRVRAVEHVATTSDYALVPGPEPFVDCA
jgi:hypothetical protein